MLKTDMLIPQDTFWGLKSSAAEIASMADTIDGSTQPATGRMWSWVRQTILSKCSVLIPQDVAIDRCILSSKLAEMMQKVSDDFMDEKASTVRFGR